MNKITNKYSKEHMALVKAKNVPISTKFSVEICKNIKNKPITRAKTILTNVVEMKEPISFVRYIKDLCHKKGGKGPARYPIKASKQFLNLLNSLEANASDKGLDTKKLIICYASASIGNRMPHPGRQSGTASKSTHVELRAQELEEKK